jgi:hypothetical protein
MKEGTEIYVLNSMIAEFMELKHPEDSILNYPIACGWDGLDFNLQNWYVIDKKIWWNKVLKYNDSWEWLMLVVEKIEEKGGQVWIGKYAIAITNDDNDFVVNKRITDSNKKLALWETVIEYIKWYNQDKLDERIN